jgi:hypothetical protein
MKTSFGSERRDTCHTFLVCFTVRIHKLCWEVTSRGENAVRIACGNLWIYSFAKHFEQGHVQEQFKAISDNHFVFKRKIVISWKLLQVSKFLRKVVIKYVLA